MAKKWWAGWKLFREEDSTTPTATEYQASGASGGEIASPTSYEGDFQSPVVIPTPQSEQRQTDQEVQGSLIEASRAWFPSVSRRKARMIASAFPGPAGFGNVEEGLFFLMPGEYVFDSTTIAGQMGFDASTETEGTHVINNMLLKIWGGTDNTDSAEEQVNQNSSAQVRLASGSPEEAFSTSVAPEITFDFSHKDDVATTRTGQAKFELVGANKVMLSAASVACQAVRNTAQSITASTWTAVSFNGEDFDFGPTPMHDNAVNPTRITVPHDGLYHIIGQASFVGSAATTIGARVAINGTVVRQKNEDGSANSDMATIALYYNLTEGDYVELQIFQNTAGAVNTETASAELYPFLSVVRHGNTAS